MPVAHRFDSMMMGLFDLTNSIGSTPRWRQGTPPIGFHRRHGAADGTAAPWAVERVTDAASTPPQRPGRSVAVHAPVPFGFDPITVWFLHFADGTPSVDPRGAQHLRDRHAYVALIDD
jgi:hypothetical protein